ncbi:MAG: serine protease, partial [Planctomycetales bacterium]|nr:serine protease [Planctomycetales bacterium]
VGTVSAQSKLQLAVQSSAGGAAESSTVFDDSLTFASPNDLPIVDVPLGDRVEMERFNLAASKREIASELATVSVTRDGVVTEFGPPSVDAVRTVTEMLGDLANVESGAMGDMEELDRPETVLPPDTRVRVNSTTSFPFRAAGRIDIGCTGTLVGPRHVLTAGHRVYNINTDQWYSRLDFTPAQNGNGSPPYGTITWRTAVAVKGWTRDHDRNYDYAMIVLDRDIGNTVGTMGFAHDPSLPNYNVNINGYPGDKPLGQMWHSYGAIRLVQPFRIYHDCDTYGGNSGSGVYVYVNSTGVRQILGIHAYGVDGTGFNGATRINYNVFNKIREWIASNIGGRVTTLGERRP